MVRQALAELGYGPEEIRGALEGLGDVGNEEAGPVLDEAALLRSALQKLAGGR